MNWITAIQTTIEYIDSHLEEQINYVDIAKIINISNMYYHQAFTILVGMTPNEYIRKRRLSLAGHDLQQSNMKVIEVAMKYGFESPESFTKAFTRFHGINPRKAKDADSKLVIFNPIKISYSLSGGEGLNYRIEHRSSFSLLVLTKVFNVERVNSCGNHDIPLFWEKSWNSGVFDKLKTFRLNDDNYAICSPISSESENFRYGIGVMCDDNAIPPKGYSYKRVESGLWAVFTCYGTDGVCMEKMWDNIYKDFLVMSDYAMRDYLDMECYPKNSNGIFSEIWVPVQKKL